MGVKVLDVDKDYISFPLVPGGDARAVVHPGMGAKNAGVNFVKMKPGQANVPHMHEKSEDIMYVISGEGYCEDFDTGIKHPFHKHMIVFVEPGTKHAMVATGTEEYIVVGTLAPADTTLLKNAGIKF